MRLARLIPASLLAGILLAGCGSGGADAPTPKTPDPAPSPEQQAANSRASEIARGQAESQRK